MGFLNPFLLWALPLASVPIIIHLLNRRRYTTVKWAAMEFLLRAMKRNRRRLRMEQWIILALRTLAVLLLILLVSRPHVSGGMLGAVQTHHVVLLDDSSSMAQRGGGGNAFDAGKSTVSALAERLAQNRNGDIFTLARTSQAQKPEIAGIAVNQGLAARVREITSSWIYGDGVLDPGAILESAAKLARANEDAAQIEFYLVTDLRKRDWLTPDGKASPAVARWLLDLEAETERFNILTVGPKDTENLAVVDVRCSERICTMGVPLTFAVEVANKGRGDSDATDLTVEIDDQTRVVHPVPALKPGEASTIEITQTFHTGGIHGITASLPGDRYAVDDVRGFAFDVREVSKAILIDGDPGSVEEDSETYFLSIALNPGGETLTGIDARITADHEFGSLPDDEFEDVDMIWLCNVSRPDDRTVERIEKFVAAGGGVVFFLGNQVDIARYNQVFYKQGKGVLPAELTEVQGDLDDPSHLHLADKDHPLFAKNTDDLEFLFERWVRVGRYIGMHVPDDAPVRTLLRLEDEDGAPLMVAHTFGESGGQVFAVGTSADTHWTNLQITPVFMVTCQEMHATAARPQDYARRNLLPSETFSLRLDPGIFRPEVSVASRDGSGDVRTFAAKTEGDEPVELPIPMAELSGYGLFELSRQAHAGTTVRGAIARNPILEEGELDPLTRTSFMSSYPSDATARVTITEANNVAQVGKELAGGGGLWRWLALGMLLGMLLETILAWRFGRR